MAAYIEMEFIYSLKKLTHERTSQDLDIIYSYLHGMEALTCLREPALRSLCKAVRYEFHDANQILYRQGDLSTCWYILLSGSVFIDGSMFLPRSSFGKRTAGCTRRPNECLILEASEMIVVDYPDVHLMRPSSKRQSNNLDRYMMEQTDGRMRIKCPSESSIDPVSGEHQDVQNVLQRSEQQYLQTGQFNYKRGSRASDTSSAYSGSDVIGSSIEDADIDLSGLVESVVDSDDEEGYAESVESMIVRDTVRDCLEKDPTDRTEDDIEILLEFMQHLPAFANMTLATRRALCAVMVFAVVEKAGTIVMNDGEELDSWSVILNGAVEIEDNYGTFQHLHMGDSFGITPTTQKMYHKGVMRTKCEDCQFVCIAQDDYYKILSECEENSRKHMEEGEVVMVTEHRSLDGGNRNGHIVIRGSPERLMSHLVEEHSSVDPTYVEDFLLTYRTFIPCPQQIADRLLAWFNDPRLRDRVTRVVLLWVNNHFIDFETDSMMSEFLEKFEQLLEGERMSGQLRLLNIACAAKARARTITLTRATRDEVLHFSVLGGLERGAGLFISKVHKGSKAAECGLKRGDQILEVNNHNFQHIHHNRALEILRGTTHLAITVKSNLLGFKEMLLTPENSKVPQSSGLLNTMYNASHSQPRLSVPDLHHNSVVQVPPVIDATGKKSSRQEKKGFMSNGNRSKLRKAFMKMNLLPKSLNSNPELSTSDENLSTKGVRKSSSASSSPSHSLHQSASNPDLTAAYLYEMKSDFPEHVIKVYKSDQTCKYLLVHRETTSREVVMLALKEFSITEPSNNYSLCEVSVEGEGLLKQKRLPDQLANLPDRIGINGRYYLKNNVSTEALVPDDVIEELNKETQISILSLNTMEVAAQLTLEDFKIFRDVEPTEYVDDIFGLESRYGTLHLKKLIELINKEMFWVVTEVCAESNLVKRSKLIKHFIKIARHCKECKNFNSMFAIVSGLGHGSVSRLKNTWERVPSKYMKLYEDMEDLMDPSRNMSKYRNLINSERVQYPMIPFFPVVKKDLTFIHLGNDSKVEGLTNFEKLRMIAKEVRHVCNMCSAQYDIGTMFMSGGGSAGTFALNSSSSISAVATMRRKRRASTLPNPKKMYEEAQMVRRVKCYLQHRKVDEDESNLADQSNVLEPPTNKKRENSPNPSNIPLGPKFGTESPQAVRKLMGLAEKSRPVHHKHNANPVSTNHIVSPMIQRRPQSTQSHPMSPKANTRSAPAVRLSAESSSVVTGLSHLRKNRGSTRSTTSTSPTNSINNGTDSGHGSMTSATSIGSMSPMQSQRHHNTHSLVNLPTIQANHVGPTPHSAPPTTHTSPTRPPLPSYHVAIQNSKAYNDFLRHNAKSRPPLPDYKQVAMMSTRARLHTAGGGSENSISPETIQYYPDGEEILVDDVAIEVMVDEEDEQVSAV
ncbi:unnamed protein product [Owenia fusiformis]|uniref:Uncharacterized protein n=1 Tax=Owenia fusiformis TaxID=6347 RepID=A0A8J1U463_OWEFU|nr:unnamed protein product [Owenia fusiformis]